MQTCIFQYEGEVYLHLLSPPAPGLALYNPQTYKLKTSHLPATFPMYHCGKRR